MKVDIILGLQWGDEGKGKIVDVFTPRYPIVARFQGGPNAGHTIEFDGNKFILHTIPSGIFHPETLNVIGNGVIIDPHILMKEVEKLHMAGVRPEDNLLISNRAHLILPTHRLMDAASEACKGAQKIGSTLKGIGPAYTDKYGRNGIRIGNIFDGDFKDQYKRLKELHINQLDSCGFDYTDHLLDGISLADYELKWFDAIESLKGFRIINSEDFVNRSLDAGKTILAEGAQGTMLDVDFGSYPFVTSSNTISAGVCSGLGISPKRIGRTYGVFKAYCTRVGSGPFPTELFDNDGETLRTGGHEFGSTTGRPRRCGWLDLPALKYAIMLNGIDNLIMMKADVLSAFPSVSICTHYEMDGQVAGTYPFELSDPGIRPVYTQMKGWECDIRRCKTISEMPEELNEYIKFVEKFTGLPVNMVSVGPDRVQTLFTSGL